MTVEPADARGRHRSPAAPAEETASKPHGVAASQPPLPQPRPAEAPAGASTAAAKDKGKDAPGKEDNKGDGKPQDAKEAAKDDAGNGGKDGSAAQAPPAPSACRLALTEEIAIAPSVPAIQGPGACGGDDLVRLEAVVLPNKKRVALTPAGIMRCTMATAVASWIRDDVAPEVAKLGSEITTLDNFDSYQCRGRNGVPSAHLSEHGKANAIDVHGFKLADGRMIDLTDRAQPRDFREAVLHSACTRFPTVLGPDSDWHHEDHIHVDLIERRSNYRICQWDVLDPLPTVAPLTPEVRPDAAPPREVAEAPKPDDKVSDPAKDRAAAKSTDSRPSDAAALSKPGNDKPGNDAKDAKPASSTAPSAASKDKPATPKPESSADRAARPPERTVGKDQPETRAAGQPDKAAAGSAASNQPSTDSKPSNKASMDGASSKKPPAEKASAQRATGDKVTNDKAARKKIAADRPARKRRHRGGTWNPFASFF